MKAIADHGARFVGCNVMFLEGGTRDHFLRWLDAEHPHLADGYRRLYTRKYAPAAYRKDVQTLFVELRDKYGLNKRDYETDAARAHGGQLTAAADAEQQLLRWRD